MTGRRMLQHSPCLLWELCLSAACYLCLQPGADLLLAAADYLLQQPGAQDARVAVLHNAPASSPPSEISQLVQAALQLPSRRSKLPGGLGVTHWALPIYRAAAACAWGAAQVICFLAHTVGLCSRCPFDTPVVQLAASTMSCAASVCNWSPIVCCH